MKGWTEFLGWSDHEAVLIEMRMGDGLEWGRRRWRGHGGLFVREDGADRFRVELGLFLARNIDWEWQVMKGWCMSWWELEDGVR